MTDTLHRMIIGFEQSKWGGGYFLFYLLALLLGGYLLREEKRPANDENQSEKQKEYALWPFAYGAWILVLTAANPITLYLLGRLFPVLADVSRLWGVLPVCFLIAYGGTVLWDKIHESMGGIGKQKARVALGIAAVLLIGLAGSGYGLVDPAGENGRTNPEVRGEIRSALQAVKQTEPPIYLVAPEEVLAYARIEEPSLYLLYGRDLYTPDMDMGIMDGYAPELMGLYEAMKNPEDCMEDIAAMSGLYDCSAIVIDAYEGAPETVGMYKKVKDTGRYLVYIQQSGEIK